MTPQTVTLIGICVLLVAIFAYDIWRDRTHTRSTISELFWGLISTGKSRIALVIGVAIGIVVGHLSWQSERTYVALRCEGTGGRMECLGQTTQAPTSGVSGSAPVSGAASGK